VTGELDVFVNAVTTKLFGPMICFVEAADVIHEVVWQLVLVPPVPTIKLSGLSRTAVPTTLPFAAALVTTSWTTYVPVVALAGTLKVALPAPTAFGAIMPTVVPVKEVLWKALWT
jgi:hypothetical protein